MLCSGCRDVIIRYFNFPHDSSPVPFEYKYAPLTQLRRSAQQGCEICRFVVPFLSATGDKTPIWVRQTYEQSTLWWGDVSLELYEPHQFAWPDNHAALVDAVKPGARESFHNYYPLYSKDDVRRHDSQRDLTPRTDDDSCFCMVRTWIECCTRGHPRCQREPDPELPTRVIDVGLDSSSPRLIESTGRRASYITLSHRWGGTRQLTTTEANILERKREIPLDGMPTTFRDAIILCRRIGIQYLWIDALCIIQDSPQDWSREANKMASVYRHSLFTISALHAKSSNGGLFVQRRRQLHVIFESPRPGEGKPNALGVRLALPGFEHEMSGSSLASRGWVYQERVLSTAILHYGEDQMFWECKSRVMSESANQIHLRNGALAYNFNRGFAHAVWDEQPMDLVWEGVVSEFTKKEFTVKTDRLAAILGVASRFGSLDIFAAGIWQPFVAKHLLWACATQESATGEALDVVEEDWKPRHPTWSWISVDYPVDHAVPVGMGEVEFNAEVLNFDDLCKPDLAAHRRGEIDLKMRVKGPVCELGFTVDEGSTRQVRHTQIDWRVGQHFFSVDCQFDPGCRASGDTVFALRVASITGRGTTPVQACSFFLLLEKVSEWQFRRIGMGSGPIVAIREIFKSGGGEMELTIV